MPESPDNPGSPATWSDWYDAHAGVLLMLARRWAANRSDAEDIVQEAFVKFWRTRQSVNNPAAYLYTCVRRAAIDHGRSAGRRRLREQTFARDTPDLSDFEPSIETDERRAALETALDQLPEEQRDVVTMKLWGGLTFDAIGQAVGVSPNTAASRYRYALQAMKRHLSVETLR